MAFPENKVVEIPVAIGDGQIIEVRQMSDKGYDYKHDGSTVTATLKGSVSGSIWTDIYALTADGQGAVPAHYNLVMVVATAPGVLGSDTRLVVSGKVL